MPNVNLHALLNALQPIETSLDELKRDADQLLERYGIPTRPARRKPVPRVRVRLLQDLTLPAGAGTARTFRAGSELVMEKARLQSELDSGRVEFLGPADARPAPAALPFGESGLAPYFAWFHALSAGEIPAEWAEQGIKVAPEKRTGVLAALWNAALVYSVNAELAKVIGVAIQARRGSAHVPVEEALLWPTQALLTLLQHFPSEEAAKSLQTRQNNRRAGASAKYARGIQAAVELAYREGETVEQTWKRFRRIVGDGAPADEFEDGWYIPDEIEDGGYKFAIEGSGDKTVVREFDIDRQKGRGIKKSTFEKYVRRARDSSGD